MWFTKEVNELLEFLAGVRCKDGQAGENVHDVNLEANEQVTGGEIKTQGEPTRAANITTQ